MNKVKDMQSISECKRNGYTDKEIEHMTDEMFVYVTVSLVDGKTKEEIEGELRGGI